jgi:DNA polymerase sigma
MHCTGFSLGRGPLRGLRSRLCDDVALFLEEVCALTDGRLAQQEAAMSRCRAVVQSLWPRAQVKPYGSFVSGLALPWSDVDLVICLPKVRKDAPAEAPGVLEGRNAIKETWQQELARRLKAAAWVDPQSIRIISHTAIPVIKVRSAGPPLPLPKGEQQGLTSTAATYPRVDYVSLDISFEGGLHNGLQANRVVTALMAESPALRPLVLVLKQFLKERGLMESYSGGLSSYGLVLMVARYLQEQPSSAMDTGSLLMGFLDFHSNHFDPRSTGISIGRRCYFSREQALSMTAHAHAPPPQHQHQHQHQVPYRRPYDDNRTPLNAGASWETMHLPYKFDPLYIEDPMCPSNNVGRNCFRIFQIQRAWSDAWRLLEDALGAGPEEATDRVPLLRRIMGFHIPTE